MPGVHTPVDRQLLGRFQQTDSALAASQRSQQLVFTDPPTGDPDLGKGDPDHGYATVVIGNLLPICGIPAIGLATYSGGAWHQITS